MAIFNNIDPNVTSGTQLATILNSFRDSFASLNKSGARDANLVAGGLWIDDTNDPIWDLKMYDGTDDIVVMSINTSTNGLTFSNASESFSIEKITDDSLGAVLELFKARLTGDQTQDGDTLGQVNFTGYTDLAVKEVQARIECLSTDAVTAGAHGSYIRILTTQDGTSSLVERVRISDAGFVGIGETSPDTRLHVKGNSTTGHIKNEIVEDSTVGPQSIKKKARVAGSGQVLLGDIIGEEVYVSTDEAGADQTVATVEVVATENTSTTAKGTRYSISATRNGDTSPTEEVNIENGTTTFNSTTSSTTKDTGAVVVEGGLGVEENLNVGGNATITGDLTVNGTTTTLNTSTLDVEDVNVTINKNGNQATADDTAGITVEMSDATDAKIIYDKDSATRFRLGESGSEVAVVDETTAQTVANKSIQTPSRLDVKQDTYANLVTYAGSATNGQLVFATDQKVMYQVVDNALTPVGAGGGGLDVFFTETFEVTNASDLTTGKGTFDSGGTLGGALADETASPISSDASLKYTTNATPASSDNDYFYLPAHTLDDKQKGNDVGITFFYTWDGSDDLVEVVIWDDTNNAKLNSSLDTIKTADNPTRFSTAVYVPTTCNAIKVGFQHTGVSEASKVLVVDDIEISTNPFVYKNLTKISYASGEGNDGSAFTAGVTDINFTETSDSNNAFDGTTYTVQYNNSNITITGNMGTNTSANYYPELFINGVQKKRFFNNVGTGTYRLFTFLLTPGDVQLGDQITIRLNNGSGTLVSNTTNHWIRILEKSESEHVVTPAKSNMTDWTAYTPATQGFGTISAVSMYYRRVGDTVEIKGDFTSGTTTASEAQIGLPSGLTCADLANADTYQVGYTLYDGNSSSSLTSLMATSGDSFLNCGLPQSASYNPLNPENGNAIFNSSVRFSVSASVPVQEWTSDVSFLGAVPVQKVAYLKDVKSANGGSSTANTIHTRDLNTVEGASEIVSLSSNQFTLQAGKYLIEADCPSYSGLENQALLYDVDATAIIEEGQSAYSNNTYAANSWARFKKEITITSSNTYEIRHYVRNAQASNGLGLQVHPHTGNTATTTTYTTVKITKLR